MDTTFQLGELSEAETSRERCRAWVKQNYEIPRRWYRRTSSRHQQVRQHPKYWRSPNLWCWLGDRARSSHTGSASACTALLRQETERLPWPCLLPQGHHLSGKEKCAASSLLPFMWLEKSPPGWEQRPRRSAGHLAPAVEERAAFACPPQQWPRHG